MNDEKFRWIRLFSPVHIPKYLVEQVKDRDFTIDDFYKYQEINCTIQVNGGVKLNPLNHLYGLVDENNFVKGFLWFVVDSLSKAACIQTYSVDRELWGKGRAMRWVEELVKEISEKQKIEKIYWVTNYPKHSERYGFRRSKSVLMEFKPEVTNGQDDDGGGDPREEHLDVDSGTGRAAEPDPEPTGAECDGDSGAIPAASDA